MKKIYYTILLLFAIASCEKEKNNFAIISGKVKNVEVDSIVLKNFVNDSKKIIKINEDRTFKDTVQVEKIKMFELELGKDTYPIYLQNGYNLKITSQIDTINNTISFSGIGSEINVYYQNKKQYFRNISGGKLLELPPDDYKKIIEKAKNSSYSNLNNTKHKSKDFSEFENKNIDYDEAYHFMAYNVYNQMLSRIDTTHVYKTPSGFLPESLLSFKVDDEDLYMNSKNYKVLADGFNALAVETKNSKTTNSSELIKFIDSICNTIEITLAKDKFIKNISRPFLGSEHQETAKKYFDYFTSIVSSDKLKIELADFYNKNQNLKAGNISPKFKNYESFKSNQTSSLNDFKGKYVYIDVWASWCGPCKKEIPFLKELDKKYHTKNIEFISISVDNKSHYAKWRKIVEDMELTGVQLIADNAFESNFIKAYTITGIPRFILLDPEGRIIDSNAPRPSNPKLIELFNKNGI